MTVSLTGSPEIDAALAGAGGVVTGWFGQLIMAAMGGKAALNRAVNERLTLILQQNDLTINALRAEVKELKQEVHELRSALALERSRHGPQEGLGL